MDASQQQLCDTSFSYGWLRSKKPSLDFLENSLSQSFDRSSFIDMDPDFFSMRWTSDSHDFDFNLPGAQSPELVHADKIFSNGLILPSQFSSPPKDEQVCNSCDSFFSRSQSVSSCKALLSRPISGNSSPLFLSAQSTPISTSSCSSKSVSSRRGNKSKSPLLRSCTKSPKKILLKYLFFLLPLYKKVKELRLFSSKSASISKYSAANSARKNAGFSSMEWCRGNADSAVHDAILYCKRSNGQYI
ncbi:uncharacterized protein [Typha latifolia]